MNQKQYQEALAKLQGAIIDQAGELLPITRIEFEVLDGGQVRWNLWAASRRLYSSQGHSSDVTGFLAASKMILEMRGGQTRPSEKGGAM